jgi:hypothetical protein
MPTHTLAVFGVWALTIALGLLAIGPEARISNVMPERSTEHSSAFGRLPAGEHGRTLSTRIDNAIGRRFRQE